MFLTPFPLGAVGDAALAGGLADVIADEQQLLQQIGHIGLVQGGQDLRRDLLAERDEVREASCAPCRSGRAGWRAGRADAGAARRGRAGRAGRSGARARSAGSRGLPPSRPASCPPAAPAAPARPTGPGSCRARARAGRCRCASCAPRRRAGTAPLAARFTGRCFIELIISLLIIWRYDGSGQGCYACAPPLWRSVLTWSS